MIQFVTVLVIAVSIALAVGTPAMAQAPAGSTKQLEILEVNPSPRTRAVKKILLDALSKYDLDRYLFTTTVQIDPTALPHSHPILTISTKYLDDPDKTLAVFLHEQMHWYASANSTAASELVRLYKESYPNPPTSPPYGSGSEFSTLGHVTVCWFELQIMKRLLGDQAGYEVLKSFPWYLWIRERVLEDEEKIGKMIRAQGLILQ